MGIPKLRLFYPSFIHHKITQNLKTSITQNSTKLFVRSVSVRKINHYYKCCIKPIYILFLYYIYCIPTFLWQKLIKENDKAIKISTQHKENRICQNRTVCRNLTISNTSVTQKNLKNYYDLRNLYIDKMQLEWVFYRSLVKTEKLFRERKSFCFLQQNRIDFTQVFPKVLLGTNTN